MVIFDARVHYFSTHYEMMVKVNTVTKTNVAWSYVLNLARHKQDVNNLPKERHGNNSGERFRLQSLKYRAKTIQLS